MRKPRIVPVLNYLRKQGTVNRHTLLEDDDSPVNDIDYNQLRQLLRRMLAHGYIREVKPNTYQLNETHL